MTESAEMLRDAGREVIQELRELAIYELPGRPYLPPPVDVEAERSVAEALLAGRRRPSALPCSAADFGWGPLRAIVAVIEALEESGRLSGAPDWRTIVAVLDRQAVNGERIAALLVELDEDEPARWDVDALAERVLELAERRRMMALMARVDAMWRCGEQPSAETMAELAGRAERWATS